MEAALLSTLSLIRKQNCSLVAAITVHIYDVFATFPEEYEYIWRARWSVAKVFYILGRYYGLFYMIVQLYISLTLNLALNTCKGYYWFWILFGDVIFTTIINTIFSLRMYAVYGGKRSVLCFFLILTLGIFTGEFYVSIVSASDAAKSALSPSLFFDLIPGCLTIGLPAKLTLVAWTPCLIANTIFFIASLVKIHHGISRPSGPSKAALLHQRPSVLRVCIRDGALFYFLVMCAVIVNMATAIAKEGEFNLLTSSWLIVAYSYGGTHLILNLRSVSSSMTSYSNNVTITDLYETIRIDNRMIYPHRLGGANIAPILGTDSVPREENRSISVTCTVEQEFA